MHRLPYGRGSETLFQLLSRDREGVGALRAEESIRYGGGAIAANVREREPGCLRIWGCTATITCL